MSRATGDGNGAVAASAPAVLPVQPSEGPELVQLLTPEGGEPDDLPRVDKRSAPKQPRDVFAYVIHEGKVRAPAAAMELIKRQET